jgi:hypothetical protein
MALVVEDGTGKADAESYASVANADSVHGALGNAAWTGTTSAKEAALRKATIYLDGRYRHLWRGTRATKEQALAWPRFNVIDEDGYPVDADVVPAPVTKATIDAALLSLTGTDLNPVLERGGQVIEEAVKVGPIEESKTYSAGAPARDVLTGINDGLSGLLMTAPGGGMAFIERA